MILCLAANACGMLRMRRPACRVAARRIHVAWAQGTLAYSPDPQSNLRMKPRVCRNRAGSRDPGAKGIPYRGFGLITLVGTTRDTSLWYAPTRGRRV